MKKVWVFFCLLLFFNFLGFSDVVDVLRVQEKIVFPDNSEQTKAFKSDSVTAQEIASGAVESDELAAESVTVPKLAPNVFAGDLFDGSTMVEVRGLYGSLIPNPASNPNRILSTDGVGNWVFSTAGGGDMLEADYDANSNQEVDIAEWSRVATNATGWMGVKGSLVGKTDEAVVTYDADTDTHLYRSLSSLGAGDMLKATYDVNVNNIVDNAEIAITATTAGTATNTLRILNDLISASGKADETVLTYDLDTDTYLHRSLSSLGGGDMLKSTYDINENSKVDDIDDNTITSAKIVDSTITSQDILNGTINKLDVDSTILDEDTSFTGGDIDGIYNNITVQAIQGKSIDFTGASTSKVFGFNLAGNIVMVDLPTPSSGFNPDTLINLSNDVQSLYFANQVTSNNVDNISNRVVAIESAGYIGEAPSDGNQYARKNGTWDIVVAGGGGGSSAFMMTTNGGLIYTNIVPGGATNNVTPDSPYGAIIAGSGNTISLLTAADTHNLIIGGETLTISRGKFNTILNRLQSSISASGEGNLIAGGSGNNATISGSASSANTIMGTAHGGDIESGLGGLMLGGGIASGQTPKIGGSAASGNTIIGGLSAGANSITAGHANTILGNLGGSEITAGNGSIGLGGYDHDFNGTGGYNSSLGGHTIDFNANAQFSFNIGGRNNILNADLASIINGFRNNNDQTNSLIVAGVGVTNKMPNVILMGLPVTHKMFTAIPTVTDPDIVLNVWVKYSNSNVHYSISTLGIITNGVIE